MKTNPGTKDKPQPVPPGATGIAITPAEGEILRSCAANCGQAVEEFVRAIILHGLERLNGLDPAAIPCPFCLKTDELELINWTQERRDGTEYNGPAVHCHRCEAVAPAAAWMMRGLRSEHGTAVCKGGAA